MLCIDCLHISLYKTTVKTRSTHRPDARGHELFHAQWKNIITHSLPLMAVMQTKKQPWGKDDEKGINNESRWKICPAETFQPALTLDTNKAVFFLQPEHNIKLKMHSQRLAKLLLCEQQKTCLSTTTDFYNISLNWAQHRLSWSYTLPSGGRMYSFQSWLQRHSCTWLDAPEGCCVYAASERDTDCTEKSSRTQSADNMESFPSWWCTQHLAGTLQWAPQQEKSVGVTVARRIRLNISSGQLMRPEWFEQMLCIYYHSLYMSTKNHHLFGSTQTVQQKSMTAVSNGKCLQTR